MLLTRDYILEQFREAGVLKEGHFLLTSGRHSDQFFLLPHLFEHPDLTAKVCADLAALVADLEVETVVGPATGGIVLAYEMARQIGLRQGGKGPRAIFTEKTADGKMALKRQWTLRPGEKVLVVEDAITTGGSVFRAMEAIGEYAPQIQGVACIADRSDGKVDFGVPFKALLTFSVESWLPGNCPLCQAGKPLVKPKG